jgi:hypothetical protein
MAPKETDVHREQLLKWAKIWDQQSNSIGGISTDIANMKVTVDGGNAFHDAVELYNQVAGEVQTWTGQGSTVMHNIAQELRNATQRYESAEGGTIRETYGTIRR